MKSATAGEAGYTIVEVMIFLTVSGVLLLSALALLNGRVGHTQFSQTVQQLDSRIKSAANEASTGTYPSTSFSCDVTTGAPRTNELVAGEQGTRSGCIFVGKVITPASTCTSPLTNTNCTAIDVYSLVGRRTDADNHAVTTLTGVSGAKPRVILSPDVTQTISLGSGARITGIFQPVGAFPVSASGIGFFQSFNTASAGTPLNSGAQNLETWVVRNTAIPAPYSPLSKVDLGKTIEDEKMNRLPVTSRLYICLKSGTSNQNASISVNSINGGIVTEVQIGTNQCV